jgi:hypothetical protein
VRELVALVQRLTAVDAAALTAQNAAERDERARELEARGGPPEVPDRLAERRGGVVLAAEARRRVQGLADRAGRVPLSRQRERLCGESGSRVRPAQREMRVGGGHQVLDPRGVDPEESPGAQEGLLPVGDRQPVLAPGLPAA